MGLFGTGDYDREALLAAGRRAHQRGRRKKALGLFRRVLLAEPHNTRLRRQVARLLAATGRLEEAREHYRIAAQRLAGRGFSAQAGGVYREALGFLPRDAELWSALAELQAREGRVKDAVATLKTGRANLRRRRLRDDAIRLLTTAHGLVPADLEVGLDLSRLLAKARDRRAARRVLAELSHHHRGRALRRVRLRQLRLSPTPAAIWRCIFTQPPRPAVLPPGAPLRQSLVG